MKKNTSWESVSDWYGDLVGEEGHYYHEHVILPRLKPLMGLRKESKLLDVACGSGILARTLAKGIDYAGVDISKSLISLAQSKDKEKNHRYFVADATGDLPVEGSFTHAAIILALQNIEHPEKVFANIANRLEKGGTLAVVLNHPCFRIPRQSSWGVDESKKLQYRRIDRYMTPMSIPIQSQPSKGAQSAQTISFHRPISEYVRLLKEAGFVVTALEEWCSDKKSVGGNSRMENRAREEFPLFLTLCAMLK
jgi:ubiquinone/menaquinone biosynthesis C-methylase UbiE